MTEPQHPEPAELVDRPGDFSDLIEDWLSRPGTKTLGDLGEVSGEKSFAVTILLLMFVAALPVPTAGITDLFAVITIVVAIQLVLGRRVLWLPTRWRRRELGPLTLGRAVPFIVRRIQWFEGFSRPRGAWAFRRGAMRVLGLAIIPCAVGTILSPPFSGLDTLPALGAVAIALGIILEDVLVVVIGVALGAVGWVLLATLGAAAVRVADGIF
jgi:hypothetical protein